MRFAELWGSLLPVGRDAATGGYRRYSFTEADAACRDWFWNTAAERSLRADCDRNGNLWAWWDVPAATAGWPARADGNTDRGSGEAGPTATAGLGRPERAARGGGLGGGVGIGEGIGRQGRGRLDFPGGAAHGGPPGLADRRDPMLPYAATVLEARQAAAACGALATFGKVTAEPGGANAICAAVRAWLDARGPDQAVAGHMAGPMEGPTRRAAAARGGAGSLRGESV